MTMPTTLDFEQPMIELEEKIARLRDFSRENDVDVTHNIEMLQAQILETRKRIFADLSPWQCVQLARHPDRPYPRDHIDRIFTDFLELHGDRRFADDHAIIGGFAKLDGKPLLVIGTQKGRDLESSMKVNFGSAHPEGYRKALRLMKLADKAGVPIVSLIDTPGAYPGIGAEERHMGEAIAVNLLEMFRLRVPVVVAVVGEGGSGGALGIGVGNTVMILEHSYYSVITPEGCAAILWRDGAEAPRAAEALKLTSADLKALNIVDRIVPEPLGGAHRDPDEAAALLGKALRESLAQLSSLSAEELRNQRYDKFRALGVFEGDEPS